MCGVPVRLHLGEPHPSTLVRLLPDVLHHLYPFSAALHHDPVQVLHVEGDVLDSVPVIHQVSPHLQTLRRARLVGGLEHKDRVLLLDDVGRNLTGSCLQSLAQTVIVSDTYVELIQTTDFPLI